MLSDQFLWYATRAAGINAWLAACLSTLVGLLMTSRVLGRRPTLPWLLDLHRYLSAMAIVFLVVHILTLRFDPFVGFGWADVLVPGAATVPGLGRVALALGVVAGWMMVVVEATSLVKKRLPPRVWHTVHLTSFGTVVLGAVHGIEIGSDTDNRLLLTVSTSVVAAMVLVGGIRLWFYLTERKRRFELEQADLAEAGTPLDEPLAPHRRWTVD